jgi:pimeloyl-ACP methyl ester carboxylesterase
MSDSGEGAPVMLLHSSGSSARQWRSAMEHLQRGYRVLAPDLVGHGASEDWGHESPSLAVEARRLEPVVRAQGERLHLVGHSYGAAVAMKIAVMYPDTVRSLTLYEPVAFRLLQLSRHGRATLAEVLAVKNAIGGSLRRGDPEPGAHRFFDYWSGSASWQRLNRQQQCRIVARMETVYRTFVSLMTDDTTLADLREVRVPVLCLFGVGCRRPVREIISVMGRGLRRFRVRGPVGAGHMAPVVDAARVNPVIAGFIACHTPATIRFSVPATGMAPEVSPLPALR